MSLPDPERTFALPKEDEHLSLTTLREKSVKIDAKVVGMSAFGGTAEVDFGRLNVCL